MKYKLLFFVMSIISVYSISISFLKKQLLSNVLKYGEYQCENITTKLINYVVEKNISNDLKYEMVVYTENEIVSIDFNTAVLNSLSSKAIKQLQIYYDQLRYMQLDENVMDELNLANSNLYQIPSSLVFKNPFIGTITPNIPIRYALMSELTSEIVSNLREYGINNALLEIKLDVKVNIMVDIPVLSKEKEIIVSVPLVIKLIQGNIPDSFFGQNVIGGIK